MLHTHTQEYDCLGGRWRWGAAYVAECGVVGLHDGKGEPLTMSLADQVAFPEPFLRSAFPNLCLGFPMSLTWMV